MIKEFIKLLIGQVDYQFYIPLIIDFIKSLLWPVTILCLAVIFRKQIPSIFEKLESFEGFGTKIKWKSRGEDAAPSLTRLRAKVVSPPVVAIARDERQAISNLAFLLFKYQFVWGAWTMGPDYCHAVRFSEKYSGGTLHFVDEFSDDLNAFMKDKEDKLPNGVIRKLEELSSYINGVLPYHDEKERLSRPVFSIPQYQTLLRSLVTEVEAATSRAPNKALNSDC